MIIDTSILGTQREYTNKEYAQKIAKATGGKFIDTEFENSFGSYWIVIWR